MIARQRQQLVGVRPGAARRRRMMEEDSTGYSDSAWETECCRSSLSAVRSRFRCRSTLLREGNARQSTKTATEQRRQWRFLKSAEALPALRRRFSCCSTALRQIDNIRQRPNKASWSSNRTVVKRGNLAGAQTACALSHTAHMSPVCCPAIRLWSHITKALARCPPAPAPASLRPQLRPQPEPGTLQMCCATCGHLPL